MQSKRKLVTRVLSVMLAIMVGIGFSITLATDEVSAASKTPTKVKSISVSSNYANGGVTVKWSKAKNVKSYQVYYATKKSGKYKMYCSAPRTENKVNISYSLKPGTKYYFKVRGVNGKKKGKFSSAKAATFVVQTPDLYSLYLNTDTATKLYFDWYSSNSNYSYGIDVYRAYEDGKYTKVKTLKKTKNGTPYYYVDKDLKTGKYSYKLRAWHKVGKKTVYSKYSNVKSIIVPMKVEITMDNWQNYFEIADKTYIDRDAFGDIEYISYSQVLRLKPEYEVQGTVWGDDADYAQTDIAYDISWIEDERYVTVDWSTGEITIGDIVESEYEDEDDYSYSESTIGNLSDSYVDEDVYEVSSELTWDLLWDYDETIYVRRDFQMNRIQGYLYLKKW